MSTYQVEEYLDNFNYEIAQKFCQRALELEPDNTRALEMTGALLLEMGDMEGAKKVDIPSSLISKFALWYSDIGNATLMILVISYFVNKEFCIIVYF